MSETVITVENLGKRYVLGKEYKPSQTTFGRMSQLVKAPFGWLEQQIKGPDPDQILWALEDVSFKVKRGEAVGIIGRNGAGKSTLLKILSRITEPTEGFAEIKGRVGSLLEVGTGMHPELTGRENIYMNATLLGMSKNEVEVKFDEIVEFSGVEKFIDTSVKRYSSGMRVRLGFAIAAHLEPEVLIVDEVLSVGDNEFQKKCLGKMEGVAEEGRTVLFVSHNMEAVRGLCGRAILIAEGRVVLDDSSDTAISKYLGEESAGELSARVFGPDIAPGDSFVRLSSVRLLDVSDQEARLFRINEGLSIEIEFNVMERVANFHSSIRVMTQDRTLVFGSGDWDCEDVKNPHLDPGRYLSRCIIPGDLLNHGIYFLTVVGMIPDSRYLYIEESVLSFEISTTGGAGGATSSKRPGILRPRLRWELFPPL